MYDTYADPEEHIIADYYVESTYPLMKIGRMIAAEESTGSWVISERETKELIEKYGAKVVETNEEKSTVKIAYPIINLNPDDGVALLLSTAAGNIFGMSAIKNIKLLDLKFPENYVKEFKGPNFGIDGIRKLVGTEKSGRPHVGTIIKPDVGLEPEEFAETCYEAATGGCDFIKDDELLGSPVYCTREERVAAVMEKLDIVKEETGRNVLYACNITTRVDKILDAADIVMDNGGNCVMLNFVTTGFSALRVLSENTKLPVHCHRDMHAAFTRNPRHGIEMMVVSELVRLCGGDQLHTGTAAGKMSASEYGVLNYNKFLTQEWFHFKTVFPVASGGVHPGVVENNIKILGNDIVLQAGGGIHGHPRGTRAGAVAMKQAVDAAMKGIKIEEYAKSHEELRLWVEKMK
ncbi:hypothetical protein BEH94_10185 [Candidatus Altiarchaeales archaeon WOR_SM1_SCG]|nr:hypothetical protein BEH94_10185 [Candidatus Altiarchaeales archaeon WOR_SM1_SCG]